MMLRSVFRQLIGAFSVASIFIALFVSPLDAQTIDPPVKVGSEVRVHESTSFAQHWHSNRMLTVLRDGSYLFVWQAVDRDGPGSEIYGQRFTASHQKTGEFRINTTTGREQQYPIAAALRDGGYVVVWQSTSTDDTGLNIMARRYSAEGVGGPEFMINQTTAGDQWFPVVSALGDGFVIVWSDQKPGSSEYKLTARRFDANNSGGSEFQINQTEGDSHITPSVATLNDGGFVVTWQIQNLSHTNGVIMARRYDANGAPTSEFKLHDDSPAY